MHRSHRFALAISTAIATLAACGAAPDGGTLGASAQALTACASNPLPRSNATASSVKGTNTAALAIDGVGNVSGGTRWESAYSDPQWIQIDLGSTVAVNRVVINWAKSASAKTYEIRLSNDAAQSSYTSLYTTGAMAATQNRNDDWSASNGLKADRKSVV
jgi:beta-glucosidase